MKGNSTAKASQLMWNGEYAVPHPNRLHGSGGTRHGAHDPGGADAAAPGVYERRFPWHLKGLRAWTTAPSHAPGIRASFPDVYGQDMRYLEQSALPAGVLQIEARP